MAVGRPAVRYPDPFGSSQVKAIMDRSQWPVNCTYAVRSFDAAAGELTRRPISTCWLLIQPLGLRHQWSPSDARQYPGTTTFSSFGYWWADKSEDGFREDSTVAQAPEKASARA